MLIPQTRERIMWRGPRTLEGADAPAVLAFRSDDFMTELETALAASPPTIAAHVAGPEHWSQTQPPLFAVPARPTPAKTEDLKLFQPAHGRFYLVAAHLCCRRFGLPDRRLSDGESVGFVLRRVEPKAPSPDLADQTSVQEYAWLPADGGTWIPVGHPLAVHPGEDVLPLAPTMHTHQGRRTRLFTGLIPVSARERYEAGQEETQPADTTGDDPLANPHRALLDSVVRDAVEQARDLIIHDDSDLSRETLMWALLDLVDFITGVAEDRLQDVLSGQFKQSSGLKETEEEDEEGDEREIPWASIIELVAEQRSRLLDGHDPTGDLRRFLAQIKKLDFNNLLKGLDGYDKQLPMPPQSSPSAAVPGTDSLQGFQYVVRCVYRNTGCPTPRPEWVSRPSAPFRFASFYDPDAPARPVRISLPVDTSPRGLRAFPRNVTVLVSKQLRAQIARVKSFDEIGKKRNVDLGMLCSLSLPIIAICALILLMVMVSILNIVFAWRPLFKICLPRGGGR